MLSTKEAHELERLTRTIHFQILREHGNVPDGAQELALTALHNQLCQMVNGEDSSWHGRWCLSAPIGFGKSSAVAAFLAAAFQMGLLANGVTVTLTAARVEQLYDFEFALLNAGIPKREIRQVCSILHNVKQKALRASDENIDVPILMITQARIRQVYRRPEERKERDLVYFLKYRDEPRDLVLWDERAQVTEPVNLKLSDIKQALASLKSAVGDSANHIEFTTWLESSLQTISDDVAKHNSKSEVSLPAAQGFIPELPKGNLQAFHTLLTRGTQGLHHAMRKVLLEFIGLLQFRLRVIPMKGHEGIITYFVVIPDSIENCLVLDASFSVSELTAMDITIQDLEQAHPSLLSMRRWYKKGLKDLKDCSSHTMIRWNKGAGKDNISQDITEYIDGKATGGNIILEVVEQVSRWAAEGKAVLLWTHKFDNSKRDLPKLLREALGKGGVNMAAKVQDVYARGREMKDQVVVENYGKHDASNAYSYCSVVVHVGVQRRNATELAASICGAKRDLGAKLIYRQIRSVQTSDAVSTIQQSTGRGQSRITVDGKSRPQISWLIYHDTREQNLTDGLRPLFPGGQWIDYKPVFAQTPEPTLIEVWGLRVLEYLDRLPLDLLKISSRKLKVGVGAGDVAERTWVRLVDRVCELAAMTYRNPSSMVGGSYHVTPWKRDGRSLVRVEAGLYGFEEVA